MTDLTCFPMHGVWCVYELRAKIHTQRLVAEADAQYRYVFMKMTDNIYCDACLQWCFGAGGNDDPLRGEFY